MAASVFQYTDYKKYLIAKVDAPSAHRGFRKQLSEAAGCQSSYLSAVLHANTHLTPDHACGICEFLKLDAKESDYFQTLVDLSRSATPRLRKKLNAKLDALRKEQEDISKRVGKRREIASDEGAAIYYSSWKWTAVHVLTSIEGFQSPQLIAKKLSLPESSVSEILSGLEAMGLVRKQIGPVRFIHSMESIHVGRDSPLAGSYHGNWRFKATDRIQDRDPTSVHFTSVTAISLSAFEEIKALILKTIDRWSSLAGPSNPEEAICFNLDLFKLG